MKDKPLDPPSQFLEALSTRGLLNHLPQGVFLVDRSQTIVYWNPAAAHITGFSAEEAVGRHCSFLSGIPCGRTCGLYDPQTPKPIIGVRCTIRGKNGQRIDLSKSVDFLFDDKGEILGGVESFVDISPMKGLERRLRRHVLDREQEVRRRTAQLEAERFQLRAMLDAMNDLTYIVSNDFRIEYMNRAMVDAFGECIGSCCYQVFFQRETPCTDCPIEEVRAGRTVHRECTFPSLSRTYEGIDTPVHGSNGVLGKLAVFRDITVRKEAAERLVEANRELDAFVYTVSHDLRAPMTPIIGYAEYLQQNYHQVLDDTAMKALKDIELQGHRMMALMEDLLILSRVGRLDAPPRQTDTVKVVEQVLSDLRSTLAEKGVAVQIGDLPDLRIPDTLLSEIFSNLIGNAVRYGGGEGKSIEVGGSVQGSRKQIFVRDHGVGISPAEKDRLFDPFFRGENAREIPGTGIGLAIVRKIVRLHGGRIWVEPTDGGGTTFRLEFDEKAELPS
jgi:PAS domain S-box-containing protein